MTQNPCSECIITSMCENACDELDLFIKDNTTGKAHFKECAPQCVRSGKSEMTESVIRRRSDGEICLYILKDAK